MYPALNTLMHVGRASAICTAAPKSSVVEYTSHLHASVAAAGTATRAADYATVVTCSWSMAHIRHCHPWLCCDWFHHGFRTQLQTLVHSAVAPSAVCSSLSVALQCLGAAGVHWIQAIASTVWQYNKAAQLHNPALVSYQLVENSSLLCRSARQTNVQLYNLHVSGAMVPGR